MCNPISWIEKDGHRLYLTGDDLKTRKGKKMIKEIGTADLCGHGAIRYYFGLSTDTGENKEVNFPANPKDFPEEIANAMKQGKLRGVFISLELLTKPTLAEYYQIVQAAWAEYEKIEQPALAEYEKIEQPALAEYLKIEQPALAEYLKIEQPARAEYNQIVQPARAEYNQIVQAAWAEYEKITQPAWAEYEKIKHNAFWDLWANPKNRVKAWR